MNSASLFMYGKKHSLKPFILQFNFSTFEETIKNENDVECIQRREQ